LALVSDLVPTRSESSGSDRKLFHNTTVTPSHFVLLVKLMSIYITYTVLYLTLFFTDCFSGFCGYRHPAGGGRLGGGREQVQAGLDGQGRLYHQAQPSVGSAAAPLARAAYLPAFPCRLASPASRAASPLHLPCRQLRPSSRSMPTSSLRTSSCPVPTSSLRPSSCPVPTSSGPLPVPCRPAHSDPLPVPFRLAQALFLSRAD